MSKKQRKLTTRNKAGNAKLKSPVSSQYLSNVMVKEAMEFTKALK